MLIQYILQNYWPDRNKVHFINNFIINENSFNARKDCMMMIKPIIDNNKLLISKSYNQFNDNVENFANKKLVSRNFMVKLLNTYWQETIFLSRASSLSDSYINQLRSDGISIYKNQYKKFLADFSKSLIIGRVEVSFKNYNKNHKFSDPSSTEIKYIWKKGLNLSLHKDLKSFFSQKKELKLLSQLKNSNFPIFTIVNDINQMIIAEPSEQLINNENIIDQVYKWYYNHFLSVQGNQPVYEGLFFINPKDALEYKKYIEYKYVPISKNSKINLLASRLDFYYKLAKTSSQKIQFHLIPDLQELGKLIYKYQYKKNIFFHSKQKYTKYSFQGQPIYLIKPVLAKHKYNKKVELIKYNYVLKKYDNKHSYDTIFMNYKTALLAWQQFVQYNHHYKFPNQPQILVYNLEDFIKTYENSNTNQDNDLLFVPTQESYEFLKSNSLLISQKNICQRSLHNLRYIKTLMNRVIWSLTSKQPVNL